MMENNKRYELGLATIKKMVSNEALENIEQMKTISPDFWEMIISFGYGDLYSREGLSKTKRSIVTLTSLITQGAFEQLEFHIRAALNAGLTKDEIKEIIIHCSGYVGFPKACQAMMMAGKIFEEVTEE